MELNSNNIFIAYTHTHTHINTSRKFIQGQKNIAVLHDNLLRLLTEAPNLITYWSCLVKSILPRS